MESCGGWAEKDWCGYCEGSLKESERKEDVLKKWRTGLTVEEYDDFLEKRHVEVKKLMKEVSKELPIGGESGLRHGELVEELDDSLAGLEEELDGLRRDERRTEEERCRMAALTNAQGEEAGQAIQCFIPTQCLFLMFGRPWRSGERLYSRNIEA